MFFTASVKSARVMNESRGAISAYIEAEKVWCAQFKTVKSSWQPVKGDVHDIGKNIVGVVIAMQTNFGSD